MLFATINIHILRKKTNLSLFQHNFRLTACDKETK